MDGGVYLPASVQKIVDCTVHITGVQKKYAKVVVGSFFGPMNDLYPDKKLVELHMFDGSSVCKKAKKIFNVVYLLLAYFVGAEHT